MLLLLITNPRTTVPINSCNAILSFLDNLVQDDHIIFHKSVDNFEIAHT